MISTSFSIGEIDMTIYAPMVRICNECGAEETYYGVMSTNNFGGDFAEPFGVGATDKSCWCGSTNFKRKTAETEIDPILLRPIDDLEFPDAIFTILKPDIYYIGDLVILNDKELLALPDFTEEFLKEVKDVLALRGLSLGSRLSRWPPQAFQRD
ncbi:hypothetical protein OAM79_00640 [Litorivicinus sp.]|nr:hypothetical protein [Litorivicinus sp.]